MNGFLKRFGVRKAILMIADCFIIGISGLISNYVLFLMTRQLGRSALTLSILFSIVCCVLCLTIFGAYNKMWRYFSRKDYLSCVEGVLIGMGISCILVSVTGRYIPVEHIIMYTLISIIGICLFRYLFKRTFISISNSGRAESQVKRAMLVGGGQACKLMLNEIKRSRELEHYNSLPFQPVCIVDDDRTKVGSKINNVPVVGNTNDIKKFIEEYKVEEIIFAIPSCPEESRQRILESCSSTGLPIKVIPFIGDLLFEEENGKGSDTAKPIIAQIRDIRIEDLLGRDPIKIDDDNIKSFLCGKVCMVTGGGGSIGSELVRQISRCEPKKLIIVDIYENNAYEIQQELRMEHGNDLDLEVLIASVRDYDRMNQIFKKFRPNVVFHAAAHKHVPLMEVSPMEAIKNNVMGTFNVATLADYYELDKFVMISTDKAVNPTNVMGASKRCCEMIVQFLSQQESGRTEFVTTRFGNVLGSNGSVIPIFKKQIEQGKPITVTHPDIIRYFMTIPEATSLVLEAATMAKGGEIFVLDMGKPVKILTLAENLIRMYGKRPYEDVEIRFTGLRPGEKIKEELLMDEEGLKKTSNKLIFIGSQIEINAEEFVEKLSDLKKAAAENNEEVAVKALHDMVPTFTTPEEFNKTHMPAKV